MRGRSPTKQERDWLDKLADVGCIVCRIHFDCFSPAEIHHIDGKTKPDAHLNTIPLCYNHHREGVNDSLYVSRHPFRKEFEKRYGKQSDLLKKVQEIINEGSTT